MGQGARLARSRRVRRRDRSGPEPAAQLAPAGRLTRVLLITHDPVGERMAGVGIRAVELARVLAERADVTVASADAGVAEIDGLPVAGFAPHAPSALRPLIAGADAVVCAPQWPLVTRWLAGSGARLIFDLYDPETLETLESLRDRRPVVRRLMVQLGVDRLADAVRVGHHLMCASEKQRDLWLGVLLAERLVRPALYDRDAALRDVLDVVPYGVPRDAPRPGTAPGPRERFAGIEAGDEILLWNGGVWSWLDPVSAIRAVDALRERRPRVRLVFMGAATNAASRSAVAEASAEAAARGLVDRHVFFNDDWVPYGERAAWLAQASCAISTHVDHLETRFAFRTRVLDCFWAGVPVVCTAGDDLAARVDRQGLGAAVAAGDVAGLASALERVLDRGRDHYAPALAAAAAEHAWPRVAEPLVRWIADPQAPARIAGGRPPARRPGHAARSAAYLATRAAAGAVRAPLPRV